MLYYLFFLLIILPIVEIAILVRIGLATEWWVPILIVLATGLAGSALARWQGWKVLDRIREDMGAGRVPADSLIDGFLVLVAGILFMLPGVLTDIVGIVLLIPPTRELVKRGVIAWFKRKVEIRVGPMGERIWPTSEREARLRHDEIIDAKVIGTRVEDVK